MDHLPATLDDETRQLVAQLDSAVDSAYVVLDEVAQLVRDLPDPDHPSPALSAALDAAAARIGRLRESRRGLLAEPSPIG